MSSQPSGGSTGQGNNGQTSVAGLPAMGAGASSRDKRTISELLDSLCSKGMRGPFLKALAESVGASSAAAQKYLTKHGNLPAPTVSDITKLMLASPEVSKAMEMYPVVGGPGGMLTAGMPSSGCVEVFGTIPLGETATMTANGVEAAKKRKKRNKKKKGGSSAVNPSDSPSGNSSSEPVAQKSLRGNGVLRPRNFLEAALYFSSITMGTVEMASDLEPEYFFAPPLLFSPEIFEGGASAFDPNKWTHGLQRAHCTTLQWEQEKALQRRIVGLFAVALLQTTNPNVKIGSGSSGGMNSGGSPSLSMTTGTAGTGGAINPRSNYLKRTIGLYAISLVDHLPPTLSTPASAGSANGGDMLVGNSTLSHFAPQRGASPILLANRKVDLDDLKVPSAHQLTAYWQGLTPGERVNILKTEMSTLEKSWINFKKTWCLCKYCRTRSTRLADVYEVLYRCYHDDLEHMVNTETERIPPTDCLKGGGEREQSRKKGLAHGSAVATTNGGAGVSTIASAASESPLKPRARKHFYRQLSELADDIIDERGYHYQLVMKRLGRAFEEDYDWGDCEHTAGESACDACRGALGISLSRKAWTNGVIGANLSNTTITNGTSGRGISSSSPMEAANASSTTGNGALKDEYTDDEDEDCLEHENNLEEEDDDDLLDTFYEDFNLIEDEDIIQAESELSIDPAHLSTAFPQLYDPRLYTMPRPAVSAYQHHGTEAERQADGGILYERFASLLFQFHLVPRYLEAEALARQRRLWEEEEEAERLEKERAEARLLAKQRKKERVRAAKEGAERLRLEAEAEEKRRAEEERQRLEDEKRRRAEEQRRIEEQRRLEEIKRLEEEGRRLEEQRRLEDIRRAAEQRRLEKEKERAKERERNDEEESRQIEETGTLQQGEKKKSDENMDPIPLSSPQSMTLDAVQRPNAPQLPTMMEDEVPPGLVVANPQSVPSSTMPPPEMASTWFDKILQGPLIGDSVTPLGSLWSPVSASLKLPPDEIPPGFSPILGPGLAPGAGLGPKSMNLDPHHVHVHQLIPPSHLPNPAIGSMFMGAVPWSPFTDESHGPP